jgi:putative Holliday junction resolvase
MARIQTGRILAVDFGEKRIGLATSDASGRLATPRVTLHRKSDEAVLDELARFAAQEEIALAVFGIPRSPEGVESPLAGRIRSFAAKFERKTGLPAHFHEETLTSNEAARRLPPGAPKEDIDREAAAVLLEDYLSVLSDLPDLSTVRPPDGGSQAS